MNPFYNSLLRLYNDSKITAAQLDTAITKGWITAEEKDQIINA